MHLRTSLLLAALLLGGCASTGPVEPTGSAPNTIAPTPPITRVSCGGPGFPVRLLDDPDLAETQDAAAAELRAFMAECRLQAAVGPDLGLASFRVAPDAELAPELTEIPVLVTQQGCNSGEDARGRIAEPWIVLDDHTVTVVFGVQTREGMHTCQGNPETPHLLVLPEPIGQRALFDGSEVPPRDARLCADRAFCAP